MSLHTLCDPVNFLITVLKEAIRETEIKGKT